MEMIQIRTEIRGMWFPEKPSLEKLSIAGSRTKDLTLCKPVCYRLRHATSTYPNIKKKFLKQSSQFPEG